MIDDVNKPQPIYLTRDIRKIEATASSSSLMDAAGVAAAEFARELLGTGGTSVLIFAGPGNNGGDAWVAARHLKQWWFKVDVVFTGDAKKLPRDAARTMRLWQKAGGICHSKIPEGKWDLVIDGLFGIGLKRKLEGRHKQLVEKINRLSIPVLSLDIPSGLDADTGQIFGCAVKASHTITFIALKPGLLTLNGMDCCGEIHVRNLGLDAALQSSQGWLLSKTNCPKLKPRPHNSHKGTFGSVGIIGGAQGMVGAALLAGRAALMMGAGRTYVSLLAENAPAVDSAQPELMLRTPEELFLLDLDCLAVGPGLGQAKAAKQHLETALKSRLPLVLDADALNLIGADASLQQLLKKRSVPTLLTPHPAEAGRLLGTHTKAIQRDRLTAALELAKHYRCHTVLKGAGSICALPDGNWFINSSGNPGLSSSGTGDVLTGMMVALLAQGLTAREALLLAVYLHGATADYLVAHGIGPAGLTASEVIRAARKLLNKM